MPTVYYVPAVVVPAVVVPKVTVTYPVVQTVVQPVTKVVVPSHTAAPAVVVPQNGHSNGGTVVVPNNGTQATFTPPAPRDPAVTPLNAAEQEAVRQVLDMMRKKSNGSSLPDNVARVTVRLPESARLFVDGMPCPLTSAVRTFDTPKLERGRQYVYTVRMEVAQNGQTLRQERRVLLAPGQQVEVNFNSQVASAQR